MNLEQTSLPAGLYIVATPIGNLRDITLRAIDTLTAADLVLCEDTRVTGKLLKYFDIKANLRPYNDHSSDAQRQSAVNEIAGGKAVALVSDAGMPLVSDPGYKLVRDCLDLGLYVTTLPGANAPLSALQLSGLPSDAFSFIGFLPAKDKARRDILTRWRDVPATLICFETGPRLIDSLNAISDTMGVRHVAVVREITKMYEEVRKGTAAELAAWYTENTAPKGEIVLVIDRAAEGDYSDEDIIPLLQATLKTMKLKDAAKHVAARTGRAAKEIYQIGLNLKDDFKNDD